MFKVFGWLGAMVQPLKEIAPWEESLVEDAQEMRVGSTQAGGINVAETTLVTLATQKGTQPTEWKGAAERSLEILRHHLHPCRTAPRALRLPPPS